MERVNKPRRRVGRPRQSGAEAVANPLNAMTPEQRRAIFLETAAQLFEEKGFASTSVEDITGAVGLTKGIFYYYWRDKKEIILEIHARAVAILNEQLDRVIAENQEPGERIRSAIRHHIDVVVNNRSLIAVLVGEVAYSEEAVAQRRSYTARFQKLVEEGIEAGAVGNADPKILTFAILGLCNSLAQWYEPQGRLGPEEIEYVLVSFASKGYANL